MNSRLYDFDAHGLAKKIDQTLLKPYITWEQMEAFCAECARYDFKMIAIHSGQTKGCKKLLSGSSVLVGAAVGFPLGQTTIDIKVAETKRAIDDGADEIDYVINLMELKSGNLAYIEEEMIGIVSLCKSAGKISKVIFENCYLSDDEKRSLCRIALRVKPTFIKTSTGFGTSGATISDVKLMKHEVGGSILIKAAGGIHTCDEALALIAAGADRLGTSAGVAIVEAFREKIIGSGEK